MRNSHGCCLKGAGHHKQARTNVPVFGWRPTWPIGGSFDTFPKLLLRNAAQFGSRPAFRHKDLGIWQTWTWTQVAEIVTCLCRGLAATWIAARRHDRHRRFQPAEALLDRDGSAGAARDSGSGLFGFRG